MSKGTSDARQLPVTPEEPEYLHDVQDQLAYVQAEWDRSAAASPASVRPEHLAVVR